eukprot:TRINITY_DN27206_c0_g1_i1.p1 TRINITY_DN27206_c0_g1~~TRINITY_DN27206_c0_g1_i1.p1  ORF type:complete len:644 (-),score=100.14 TRINITY_DN27206_c0_g1_i1:27-1958(-)
MVVATIFSLSVLLAAGLRDRSDTNYPHDVPDTVDIGPLFLQDLKNPGVLHSSDARFKCCCTPGNCKLAKLEKEAGKKTMSGRDQDGCGVLKGFGHESFHRGGDFAECRMTVVKAMRRLKANNLLASNAEYPQLRELIEHVTTERYYGRVQAFYTKCDTTCGQGFRQIEHVLNPDFDFKAIEALKDRVPCQDLSDCEWTCEHAPLGCGWGKVGCTGEEQFCELKGRREASFPERDDFRFSSCFKECPAEKSLSSMCAVTANHLDEQYGSLKNMIAKTCLAGPDILALQPNLIVVMTQELNRVARLGTSDNVFPNYVGRSSLAEYGYVLAGVCDPAMSANSAVYVKQHLRSHVFSERVECSGLTLKSKCSWTNCKGASVMGLSTTSGKLVVGNWHGTRSGHNSWERVLEFENAASYIGGVSSFLGRKLVVWGGDVNVRSDFSDANIRRLHETGDILSPESIFEVAGGPRRDIIGQTGWTVDQHLRGEVGVNETLMLLLKEAPLKQVQGWNTLCPTYRKEVHDTFEVLEHDGTYRTAKLAGWDRISWRQKNMVKRTRHHMRCRTPADQLADGIPSGFVERLSMKEPWGKKSRAPSWTERIFLSEELFENCGKLKKDIRNRQGDHDPVFVFCSLPFTAAAAFDDVEK